MVRLKKKQPLDNPFERINFEDRYFKKQHHWAFRPQLWEDDSPHANRERAKAKDRFLELHETIYPQFVKYGLSNLYPNVRNHIVSMDYHFPGQTSQKLNAMWLSYGKSQDEIREYKKLFPKVSFDNEDDDKQSFINHARLQIRIDLKQIGLWLLFGKNNDGSLFDRQYFFDKMNEASYRLDFFNRITSLPSRYHVQVNRQSEYVIFFDSPETLHDFCKKDRSNEYFYIGCDYKISEQEMSEQNLPNTVLRVYNLLNPLYKMMKHRFV